MWITEPVGPVPLRRSSQLTSLEIQKRVVHWIRRVVGVAPLEPLYLLEGTVPEERVGVGTRIRIHFPPLRMCTAVDVDRGTPRMRAQNPASPLISRDKATIKVDESR